MGLLGVVKTVFGILSLLLVLWGLWVKTWGRVGLAAVLGLIWRIWASVGEGGVPFLIRLFP